MSALEGLTALEREQLRYIVERVEEWPERAEVIWVNWVGIYLHDGIGDTAVPNSAPERPWNTSRDFTRAQYDAMKAEIKAESGKCVHTEHCCLKHGCKYGDEDCPVYRGEKPQSFPCETCDWEKDIGVIDYRAHCEALAGALENARAQIVAWQGEPHPYSCTIHKAIVAHIDEALTRWKEDSK